MSSTTSPRAVWKRRTAVSVAGPKKFSVARKSKRLDNRRVLDLARSLNARVTLLYALPSMDHHPTGTPFVSPVPIPSDEPNSTRSIWTPAG